MLTRAALRQAISQSFSIEELEMLCADLGIDPESIPGRDSGKDYWITQILAHFQRRDQMPALLAALKERRLDVAWDVPAQDTPAAPAAPWWDSADDIRIQPTELPAARGDVIMANISNSNTVAAGKNITLTLGTPAPDDRQVIAAGLTALADSIAGDGPQAQIARLQLKLLQGELTRADEGVKPDSATIIEAAGWLLDNAPQAAGALRALFALPAVGRVMSKAGAAALLWARQHFGV